MSYHLMHANNALLRVRESYNLVDIENFPPKFTSLWLMVCTIKIFNGKGVELDFLFQWHFARWIWLSAFQGIKWETHYCWNISKLIVNKQFWAIIWYVSKMHRYTYIFDILEMPIGLCNSHRCTYCLRSNYVSLSCVP